MITVSKVESAVGAKRSLGPIADRVGTSSASQHSAHASLVRVT